jgi:hypothetical protein
MMMVMIVPLYSNTIFEHGFEYQNIVRTYS